MKRNSLMSCQSWLVSVCSVTIILYKFGHFVACRSVLHQSNNSVLCLVGCIHYDRSGGILSVGVCVFAWALDENRSSTSHVTTCSQNGTLLSVLLFRLKSCTSGHFKNFANTIFGFGRTLKITKSIYFFRHRFA